MKNIFFIIISSFFVLTSCQSQNNSIDSKKQTAILYEIKGKGLEKPSYIFGTLHVVPKDVFEVPQYVEDKLAESESLVLEIDPDIPLKTQIELAQRMLLPNGKSLKDYLPEEEYLLVRALLIDSLGVSESKTDRYLQMKPVYLTSIVLKEYLQKIESYEMYFNKLAKKNSIELTALETVEFQMNLLDTISIEDQAESYVEGNILEEYNQLLDIYLQGNLDSLYRFLTEYEGYNEIEAQLITTRNHNWIPQLEDLLSEKNLFIAVGAGHLPGEEGVLELLRARGYSIQQVLVD